MNKTSSQEIVDFTITLNTMKDKQKDNESQLTELNKTLRDQDNKLS